MVNKQQISIICENFKDIHNKGGDGFHHYAAVLPSTQNSGWYKKVGCGNKL